MGMTGLKSFDRSLVETKAWLNDMKRELHYEDEEDAYEATRASLHALRDRLTTDEAANFAAQLPMLLKGVYYERWRPADAPLKIKNQYDFFEKVAAELPEDKKSESERITRAFMKIVKSHVGEGMAANIESQFPADLKNLFE